MIHIVFEEANIGALQKSFELDTSLKGEIISVKDEYAVGPLQDIYTDEGIKNRNQWWQKILQGGHYDGIADDGHVDDNKELAALKEKLTNNPEEVVWIWAAQNKHDVSGYYWLAGQLKDFEGRVYILYLHNLPFINENGGLFYPASLFQIPAKEFVKAKKLARLITASEFETDLDEWIKITKENKGVRLLEGGKKLIQKEYDYYDPELVKFISKDWQKVSKFFQQYYSKIKDTTGDAYLLWRLNQLAEQGKIETQGNSKNMKEFEVRLAGAADSEMKDSGGHLQ